MNGQGSDICIHNNKVCSLAPADRINVITSPRSAKAVEDAPFGPQDISPIKKHQQYIDRIVLWAIEKSDDELKRLLLLAYRELELQQLSQTP